MLSLFFTEAAAGSLLVLLLIPPREAGRKFFRFTVCQSCLLILLGLSAAPGVGSVTIRPWLFGLAAAALMGSAGMFHLGRPAPGLGLLAGGLAPALVAVVLDALAMIPRGDASPLSRALYPLDAVSAGLLSGSVLIAMILGHYYLNVPGLSIRHLQRMAMVFMMAVGLRLVVVGVSVVRSGAALRPLVSLLLDGEGRAWPAGGLDPYVLVFLLLHLVFGTVAPAIMSVMAWRTSLISSTQSATGILYVALLMVIMGELASRYILTLTSLPL